MLKVFLKILFISFMFINLSYSAEIGNAKQIKFEQTLQAKINKFQMKKWFYITMLREDCIASLESNKNETNLNEIKNILIKYDKEKTNNNYIYGLMAYNLYQEMYKILDKNINNKAENGIDLDKLQVITIPDSIYDNLEKELINAIGSINIILKNIKE